MAQNKPAAGHGPWYARPVWRVELPSGMVLDTGAGALVMGVLNVTPDSFSDGGCFFDRDLAVKRGLAMADEGADVLDVGGESTRPGSEATSAEEEKARVLPVIEALAARTRVPIGIDTRNLAVAAEALDAGAQIINDVSAMRTSPEIGTLAAERGSLVCLMHMQGTPGTMQARPTYGEVVHEVCDWLGGRVEAALMAGVPKERVIVDPGFGFGKTPQHNLELLRRLQEFHALGCAVMVGTSRKSTIGAILGGAGPGERLYGTLATVACAVMAGCHMVRVHDVGPAKDVVATCEAVRLGMGWSE
ncbi:MAG: dihydropteroate synthase [Candidatus Brocadiia bacterium]|jgi:dihydropteroate synthase|nr:dihydropteroate synthase [Candidatus Brocadiia bacterium]